jgi:hypothetical protein
MNSKTDVATNNNSIALNLISVFFGIVFIAIGFINTFWGNDPGFGIFIILLSLVYFPPANALLKEKARISIPRTVKILVGGFILWAALGVGELFGKIAIMLSDLNGN